MAHMAKCGQCGVEFEAADDAAERVSCPACGATTRTLEDSITLGVQAADHAMLELLRHQEVIATRESVRDGRVTWSDEEDGCIRTTIMGTSPQNEADSLKACRILVRTMNLLGDTWDEPTEWSEQKSDIDCVATDARHKNKKLYIQVVKAMDEKFWRTLSISKTNTKSGTPDELADTILRAVKIKYDRTPLGQRSKLVLAIDANRLVGLTHNSVVHRVREKHGTELAAMGFRSIWLVGPSISRTHQLASAVAETY